MQEKSLDVEDDLIGTVIDEDEIQQDYEPSETEILGYAVQLGMKPEEDKTFLYLAREGLKAPIPKPWSACRTKNGRIFYYNFETGESQWDHPSDKSYKEKYEQLKRERQIGHKSKNFLSKSDLSVISDIMAGSNVGEINILNSKNFPESLNFSGINQQNEENIARQSISHRSNVLSDEFRRNLEKINPEKEYSSHNAEQQQIESNGEDKKEFMSGMSLISQDRKENSNEDMLNQRVDSEDVRNMISENTEEQEENLLGELEVSSISAFQKYEDDLKAQFGYVLSEFERNYQDHAAKIEQQYQREIGKSESDSDSGKKGSENSDIQNEMRSFETKVKGESDEDLKQQIVEVNMQYEAKRKEMEERAEREIQQCMHEVMDKCQSGFQELAHEKYFSRVKKNSSKSGHKRAHSVLTQGDQIQKAKEIETAWAGKRSEIEIEYQSKGVRLEEELANKYETDLSNFRSETSSKLENDKQIPEDKEDKFEVWKNALQKEYQNKLNLQISQMKQEYLLSKVELEGTLKRKDIKSPASIAIENSLKAEFDAKIKSIQLEKALLEQQFQKLREINYQQAKEKLQLVRECLNNEENELARDIKLELKSIDKQIAEREGLLGWLRDDKKAADDIEKSITEKEKSIKVAQKEIDDLEDRIDQLKRQAKLNKAESEEKQRNKTIEKVSVLDKISELSNRLDRVEVEIDLIKQKPQESFIGKSQAHHPNINIGALHSPKGFNKIFRGVQEIKKVIAQKHRRSTSVEKVHVEELSFDMPYSTKVARTGIRGYRGFNARRSSLEPKSDIEESSPKISLIEKLSPIRPKQTVQQAQGSNTKKMLSESKMMSFEWEEEEEKESHSIDKSKQEKSQRQFSPSLSKIQSDWKSLIKIEKGLLVKYNHLVQKKKIETRIIQNTLEKEQMDYKVEYIQYKNDPYKTYSKKLKLEVLKKSLNSKIQDYNKALSWLRSQEGIMTSKHDLLKNLEHTFEKACQHKNFDEDALFDLYKVFKSVQLDLPISEEFKDIREISFMK